MSELELLDRRMAPLEVFDGVEYFRVLPQRSRYRAQTSDVLRVTPPGVVTPAIAVRDERRPHRAGAYSTGRRRRSVMTKIDPVRAAVDEIGASSSRTSKPLSLTTYSFS